MNTLILEKLNVGKRTFNYIQDFLKNRKVQISIGGATSKDVELGRSGTPQGSVLSPFLFNVSMIGLPEKLAAIEGIQHSLYADDITIWMKGGSDGFIQEQLQEAINTVEDYVRPRGLACSPAKSELLLIKRCKTSSDIELYSEGRKIPTIDSIRILGLRIQADGGNKEAINIIKEATYQTIRLISRVSNRHHGMKEKNLIRLIKAFVISRIAYATPFLRLNLSDKEKLNCLIRKSYKRALGLGDYTPNKKLEALGLHNNIEEIIEAQRTSQLERLTKSDTGRHILKELGIKYVGQSGDTFEVPEEVRKQLCIPNLPKHMHPVHNVGRREARAKALAKMLQGQEDVVYTDAALITTGKMVATVTDESGCIINCCSIKTKEPAVAEEVAIALATRVKGVRIIVTDSKNAILQFTKGRVSRHALRVLRGSREDITTKTSLLWTPAHSSLPGNEAAHNAARGLVIRADVTPSEPADFDWRSEKMVSYREVLDYYVESRKQYPPADTSLDRRASVRWRQLQTGTFPCPARLAEWYPEQYKSECKLCSERATLDHIMWRCAKINRVRHPVIREVTTPEQWDSLLKSTDSTTQEKLVQVAADAARAQGLLAAV